MAHLNCYGIHSIKHTLRTHNIALKKRWGQNFITEQSVSQSISKLIYAIAEEYYKKKDISYFWEIGPGLGALTNAILEERATTQVTLFEIDHGIINILRKNIDSSNLSKRVALISGDAVGTLTRRAKDIDLQSYPQVIYGNLPYSSAVRIMLAASLVPTISHIKTRSTRDDAFLHTLEAPHPTYSNIPCSHSIPMCYMLQADVAARMMASIATKSYGATTILFQSFYHINLIYKVSPHIFYPVPHVDSVVCALTPREQTTIHTLYQRNILKRLVHVSFSQRRKKLSNTLGAFLSSKGITTYKQICERAHLDLNSRPEEVVPDTYMTIAVLVSQYLTDHSELSEVLLT